MTARGPRYDRHWLVVDDTGLFLTQRSTPKLARFWPTLHPDHLEVRFETATLTVPLLADAGRRTVTVWKDTFGAIDCGDAAAAWFSAALSRPCRLVHMADDTHRRLDPKYVRDPAAHTGFADAYPVLLANEASLTELNSRLTVPVPMNRFRANIVVQGPTPWAEEGWAALAVGSVTFEAVKPCSRCVVITTDQATGEQPSGPEPLRTLASYRTVPGLGAIFGMNLVPNASSGTLRVGDPVQVLKYTDPHV
jgi:uncharacterized protein YcbX